MSKREELRREIDEAAKELGLGKVSYQYGRSERYGCIFWWRIVFDDNAKKMLKDALKKTNELQLESDKLNMALAAGRVEDISQVVVAAQKADIAIQLTLQLRNRAVSAYQEIMRMQV